MWAYVNIVLFLIQTQAWPLKRDVELFGLKFQNPANMGTMIGSSGGAGTIKNPANFASTLTGSTNSISGGSTAHQQNPANFASTLTGPGTQQTSGSGTSSGGSTAHQQNPANFASTLTGPGTQQTSGSGTSSGGSTAHQQNPANFASTLTGPGTQQTSGSGTSSGGSTAHQQNPANFASTLTGTGTGNTLTGTGQTNGHSIPGDMTGFLDQTHGTFGSQGGYVQHQNHENPDFNILSAGNTQDHLPGKCVNSHPDQCSLSCQEVDSVTGCIVCKSSCQSSGQSVSSTTLAPVATTPPAQQSGACPIFPANCPRGSVAIQNGCPVCTATTAPTTSAPTTVQASATCAPVRCLAPCNKGIKLDAANCPVCVC